MRIVFKDCHDEADEFQGTSLYPSCDLRETETVDSRQRRIGLLAMKETVNARRQRFECTAREMGYDYATNRPQKAIILESESEAEKSNDEEPSNEH